MVPHGRLIPDWLEVERYHFDCLQEHRHGFSVFSNSYTVQSASMKSNWTSLLTPANSLIIH